MQAYAQTSLKLNPPRANITEAIIKKGDTLVVTLDFRMEGASIYYSIGVDDKPDNPTFLYTEPIIITKPCLLKARTEHEDFTSSDYIWGTYLDPGIAIQNIEFSISPDPKWQADGIGSLIDGQLGNTNLRKGYLGFDSGPVSMTITFEKPEFVSGLIISNLVQQAYWIFTPETFYDPKSEFTYNFIQAPQPVSKNYNTIQIEPRTTKALIIELSPLEKIPEWHVGTDKKGWMFLDEIIVY